MAAFRGIVSKFIKKGAVLALLALMLVPLKARAEESLQMFLMAEDDSLLSGLAPGKIKRAPERRLFLEVDEHGDVVMKRGNLSMILAYNGQEDVQRSQERGHDLLPQDAPLMGGFSVK